MALALTALGIYGPQIGIILVVAFLMVWGTAISCLFTGLQTWVLRIAGDDTVPATAVHTAVLNSAIGLGVIIGGNVLDVTGLKGTMISAGMMIVPAIILLTILIIRAKGCTATE